MKIARRLDLPALDLMAACVVPHGGIVLFVLIAPTPSPFGSRDDLSLTASKLRWNKHDHVRMLLQRICDPFWLKSGQKARRPFKAFGSIDGRARTGVW